MIWQERQIALVHIMQFQINNAKEEPQVLLREEKSMLEEYASDHFSQ